MSHLRTAVIRALFSFASILVIIQSTHAQSTWFVNGPCGNDAWSGSSPECQAPNGPKRTIQAGMDVAQSGDTVLVADGIYTGTGNKGLFFPSPRFFMLRSANGPAACTIDLQGSGMAFFFVVDETPEAVVEGFTIRNGADGHTGGIYFHHNSRVVVVDCVFENNLSAYGGGAIYLDDDASPTILDCRFIGNTSLGGAGAIAFAGSSWSRPRVINCSIVGNSSPEGGGVYFAGFGDSPALINCTIVGNEAKEGGALYLGPFSNPEVVNSILWGNVGGAIGGEGGIDVTFSDVEGGWAGTQNIDLDPLLESLSVPRPTRHSPCIDAGDNAAVPPGVTTDLSGLPRFQDGNLDGLKVVDMGAHEFQRPVHLLSPSRVREP